MIAHHSSYTRIYKKHWIAIMIVFCWIFAYGMQLPTFFGVWGKFTSINRFILKPFKLNFSFCYFFPQEHLAMIKILAHVQLSKIRTEEAVKQRFLL